MDITHARQRRKAWKNKPRKENELRNPLITDARQPNRRKQTKQERKHCYFIALQLNSHHTFFGGVARNKVIQQLGRQKLEWVGAGSTDTRVGWCVRFPPS